MLQLKNELVAAYERIEQLYKEIEYYKNKFVPVAARSWNKYTAKWDFNTGLDDAETLYSMKEKK